MDRLDILRAFALIAEHSSFSEAARRLNVSPTAVSRGIASLEESLGVVLLRRTTRSLTLTSEGETYLERASRALEELNAGARELRGENEEPRGLLVISAPLVFGRIHMLRIVDALVRMHERLNVRLMTTDRVVRIAEEGIDVAARIAELPDSALRAQKIWETRRVLVASPDYLGRRGAPTEIAHLASHDLISFDAFAPNGEWRFANVERPIIRISPRLVVNAADSAIDAAAEGVGITRVFCYQVAERVTNGSLVHVLESFEPPPVPISLVYQANRARSPNVRALIEATKAYFHERASVDRRGASLLDSQASK
ncbi:MAG: LysR family transcriptional regulator [Alphaproteobacteria bacterium]|nr:LysR family transcriptional regulator [Alphaproteobacteria bacterium]MBM3642479.1 LysR family transcriptional regulator [Alphaproteobacteria bacterium]